MAARTTYEQKGSLREERMKDTATLAGFHPLESDWRELFRWLMSVSGDLPYYDDTDSENGRLSSLWENHVLTVLVDILQKDIDSYVDSFTDGWGTSVQHDYTVQLQRKFAAWEERLRSYIRQRRSIRTDSPAVAVAELLVGQLESALLPESRSRSMRFASFMDDANQPYFQMLGAVEDIQQKADEYIVRIESDGSMDASLALLLTFVRNYCGIAEGFNSRFGCWAEFYRRNILHDVPKPVPQQNTYIVKEHDPEKSAETYSLPKGTKFPAGKKDDGSDLYYATTEKAYIVPAQIQTAYTLFRKDGRLCTAPLACGQKNQHPLFDPQTPGQEPWEYGWMFSSRSLVLSEGRRTVCVRICFDTDNGTQHPDLSAFAGSSGSFLLQVSGSEGWIQRAHTCDYDPANASLLLVFTIGQDEEAPAVCSEELHGITSEYPALRILFAESELLDTLPPELCIESLRIDTQVEGIRNFTLQGDAGLMDPTQPLYPFGSQGERDSRLIFGHEETASKEITAVSLRGAWSKLPEGGFGSIYRNYDTPKAIDDDSFEVCCQWQRDGRWHECVNSPLPLFGKGRDGRLSEEAVFELSLTEAWATDQITPYRRDNDGFYRLVLIRPDIGFGMSAYYRGFSEVMMHNSRKKEKHHKPVPEMPQIPMLTDVTFGYRSEEVLCPKEGARLYRISGRFGYEECMEDERLGFLPDMASPALLVGMDNMGDTSHVRMYFDLSYVVKGGMPVSEQTPGIVRISQYAGSGIWQEFTDDAILCDQTEGLTRSGFIEVKIQSIVPEERLWLRFGFDGDKASKGVALNGIYMNYLPVMAVDEAGNPLPAGSQTDAGVRQRIRISTRNRAVWSGNYEELILERFPDIEKACCLPAGADGIRIAVFPKPEKRKYPFLPVWRLSEIENQVRQHASPFATIRVVNPVYEPLTVRFKAVLRDDTRSPGEVKRRTERRIRVFFMAWYMDGRLPDFGVSYSHKALLSRIENDECIEEATLLEVTKESTHWERRDGDMLYTPASNYGVLYIEQLDVELTTNRCGVERARLETDFRIG